MRIQICDCLVTLAGNVNSITNVKKNITVPEAVVLNTMHGGSAISHICSIREIETTPIKEKGRLLRLYVLGPADDDKPPLVERLFPGMAPTFPETFRAAGFELVPTLPFPAYKPPETIAEEEEFQIYEVGEDADLPKANFEAEEPSGPGLPGVVVPKGKETLTISPEAMQAAEKKLAAIVGAKA